VRLQRDESRPAIPSSHVLDDSQNKDVRTRVPVFAIFNSSDDVSEMLRDLLWRQSDLEAIVWGEGITVEDMTALRWVRPKIVVEVSFAEWKRDGLLRHPEFVGVRDDKWPRDVRREQG
jgi:ATP-dependent DNA ligase